VKRRVLGCTCAFLAFSVAFGFADALADDARRWVFATGVDYTNGDYGEAQDTTIVTAPLIASYLGDRWSVTLTVPIVSVEGPGTVVPGSVGGGSGGGFLGGLLGGADAASPVSPMGGVDETGLGDVSLAVSATPVVTEGGTQMSVTGRVRAPTADESRSLGTGEAAASLAGGLRQPIGDRAAVFGSVGYEHAFDSGAGGVFAGVGAESYVASRVLLGATVDFAEANSELHRDSTQASGYIGFDATANTRILAYGSAGLTETSPDIGAGLRLVFTP